MEFQDRAVIVTGGTGALGAAVVGALLEAGAACHVPYLHEQEAVHFPHRDHPRLTFHPGTDLTDEAALGDRAAHLARRTQLPTSRLRRLGAVGSELLSGRYFRYSNGLRSAGRDLVA